MADIDAKTYKFDKYKEGEIIISDFLIKGLSSNKNGLILLQFKNHPIYVQELSTSEEDRKIGIIVKIDSKIKNNELNIGKSIIYDEYHIFKQACN